MLLRCCPKCFSLDVHRSRAKSFLEMFVLPVVFLRPYRCGQCEHRYYGVVASKKYPLRAEHETPRPAGRHLEHAPLGAPPR
ncbi:MAG: hypothetical protein ACRD35_08880 [Candidatus Acidiferrales bacterium]